MVACLVAQGVIDALEVIDVDDEQANRARGRGGKEGYGLVIETATI
jgi:hypothetical protein